MTLKLSRADALRTRALDQIDRHYAGLIAAEVGPLGHLHALKRQQAVAGKGGLLDGDAGAVLERAAEQDERLARLDRERRQIKGEVRAARTADAIHSILSRLSLPRQF